MRGSSVTRVRKTCEISKYKLRLEKEFKNHPKFIAKSYRTLCPELANEALKMLNNLNL